MRIHFHIPGSTALRSAALLVCVCMGVSGCDLLFGEIETAAEEPCSWITDASSADADEAEGETVVMLDASASMMQSESGRISDFTEDIAGEMLHGFMGGPQRRLTLGVFSGQKSHINYAFANTIRPHALDQGADEQADRIQACIEEQVAAALEQAPAGPDDAGTDVLAAIDTGARAFDGAGDRRLTVVTDGHSNMGCLNLSRVLHEPDYEALEKECGEKKEWPTADFSDITLRLVGVSGVGVEHSGDVTGAQAVGQIRDFWNTIGARLPGAGDTPVVVESDSSLVEPPEPPGDGWPADPPIAVFGPDDLLVIDTEALFKTDSAELLPSAEEGIDEVLANYGPTLDPALGVTVTGHTDSRGSDSYNKDLSRRRAQAVRSYLESAGFAEVRAEGKGSSAPVCDDGGEDSFDDECGRLNRRVEIRFNQD
ncbi:OmpA family protein [Streptomonospora litoralis]|uniref:Outer membrane protein A n=1 Tax=Streptomonospora litoralis TaxID=2498135 RepID=A0A4V0ZJI6_9ACTN|nr:OmpA family protein [Streptomonospora litoralis]QBI53612.1 Outer membrane protein A precursor [Streptomonospora litoralis]